MKRNAWVQGAGTWLVVLAACGLPSDDGRYVVGEPGVIDATLVSDDRWALVKAVDLLIFDAAEHPCAELMAGPLADQSLREDSNISTGPTTSVGQHARNCDKVSADSFNQIMGKVTRGRRSVLVTGSYLSGACDDSGQDEISRAGQVLAAGCEEVEIRENKKVQVEVVLFPHRDPR